MAPSYRVVMQSGPTPGREFPLEQNELYIGRDLGNAVVINDPEISRRHSRMFLQNGAYSIEDNGSTNGTSVNNQRLVGPCVLRSGDVITLGERISLVFQADPSSGDATMVASGDNAAASSFAAALQMPAPVAPPAYAPPPQAYNPPPPAYTPPPPGYTPPPPAYAPAPQAYNAPPPAFTPAPVFEPVNPPAYSAPPARQQPVYQPVQQPPAYEPVQSPFAGQVPAAPDYEAVEVRNHIPVWIFLIIAALLLAILVLVIDDFRLWCPIFGWCS